MTFLASRPAWIAAALALAACAATSFLYPPVPLGHDEFSYLLAGDTFASGRLANPTHPLWEHFETMHVLQHPTYASKYPPGQGLVLAVGTWIAGRPIVGVWLSHAAAAAAIAWMLAAWIGRPWPLVGGILVALHPRLLQAWGDTYYGGAVAIAGGALVYGALPRVLKRPAPKHAVLLGLGLVCLALSRPFEGLVASVPAAIALGLRLLGPGRPPWPESFASTVVPLGAVLLLLVVGLAIHDRAVTGHPLRLPHFEFHRQYEVVPLFLFQPLAPEPAYMNPLLRLFYAQVAAVDYHVGRLHWLEGSRQRLLFYAEFFLGPFLAALAVALPLVWRDARVRFACGCIVLLVASLLVETFAASHYAAPLVALGVFLVVSCLQRLWDWKDGVRIVRISVCALLLLAAIGHARAAHQAASFRASLPLSRRAELAEHLVAQGEKHLVVVRYAENHNPHLEWVYNAADIDGAGVVWARELDAERNARLCAYFADRRAWLYQPDRNPEQLEPYPGPGKR